VNNSPDFCGEKQMTCSIFWGCGGSVVWGCGGSVVGDVVAQLSGDMVAQTSGDVVAKLPKTAGIHQSMPTQHSRVRI
jgi:hypothetical protein